MGRRVHVCKKYDVQYGTTATFNNDSESLFDMLEVLGAEPHDETENDDSYTDYFECPIESYKRAIENLKKFIADPSSLEDADLLKTHLHDAGVSAEWLLETLNLYLEEGDKSNDWLHFVVF